jgi:hypothetical protein
VQVGNSGHGLKQLPRLSSDEITDRINVEGTKDERSKVKMSKLQLYGTVNNY